MNRRGGFTLIEIIIAMAVLAIIVMPLTSLLVASYKVNRASVTAINNDRDAQTFVERFKAEEFKREEDLIAWITNADNEFTESAPGTYERTVDGQTMMLKLTYPADLTDSEDKPLFKPISNPTTADFDPLSGNITDIKLFEEGAYIKLTAISVTSNTLSIEKTPSGTPVKVIIECDDLGPSNIRVTNDAFPRKLEIYLQNYNLDSGITVYQNATPPEIFIASGNVEVFDYFAYNYKGTGIDELLAVENGDNYVKSSGIDVSLEVRKPFGNVTLYATKVVR